MMNIVAFLRDGKIETLVKATKTLSLAQKEFTEVLSKVGSDPTMRAVHVEWAKKMFKEDPTATDVSVTFEEGLVLQLFTQHNYGTTALEALYGKG